MSEYMRIENEAAHRAGFHDSGEDCRSEWGCCGENDFETRLAEARARGKSISSLQTVSRVWEHGFDAAAAIAREVAAEKDAEIAKLEARLKPVPKT